MAKFLINGFSISIPDHLMNDAIRKSMAGGRYEGHETAAIEQHLLAGDRVLELGAGAGYIALQIASRIGGANLLTVEANPKMVPVVEKNLAANGVEGVTVINGAVVPDNFAQTHIGFHMTAAFWASSLNPTLARKWKSTQTAKVPAVKISTLMRQHRPTVVIMDIEGGEAGLFDAPWPDHLRLMVVELHPLLYEDEVIKQIFDAMSAQGFSYCPAGSFGQVVVFKRLQDAV